MREQCAPVEIIHDSATRRIVDLTATSVEKLQRGLQMLYEAREVLAEVEREMEWRLEARKAACTLEEVCGE
jgi:hypothetical protein